jgi:hypothetical protein
VRSILRTLAASLRNPICYYLSFVFLSNLFGYYRFIINDCPMWQLALKTHTNFRCAAASHRRQTSRQISTTAGSATYRRYTHVMRLAAHSTTSPTPTTMEQSFIMTLSIVTQCIFIASRLVFVIC